MANSCCIAKPFTALRDLINRVTALEENSGSNMDSLRDTFYPVGSIYMSINSQNPATFIGGTWTRIQDKFLLAAGENFAPGTTGGEATHVLTELELPVLSGSFTHRPYGTGGGTQITASSGIVSVSQSTSSINGVTPAETASAARDININFGGGAEHNNMPPYQAVYIWRRTA